MGELIQQPQKSHRLTTPLWLEKLRSRWKLNSITQVMLILCVFACTGLTVMFVKPWIHHLFFDEGMGTWFHFVYWILILPFYNVLLLCYGFLFGQFRFFWEFEKKMFRKILRK